MIKNQFSTLHMNQNNQPHILPEKKIQKEIESDQTNSIDIIKLQYLKQISQKN